MLQFFQIYQSTFVEMFNTGFFVLFFDRSDVEITLSFLSNFSFLSIFTTC